MSIDRDYLLALCCATLTTGCFSPDPVGGDTEGTPTGSSTAGTETPDPTGNATSGATDAETGTLPSTGADSTAGPPDDTGTPDTTPPTVSSVTPAARTQGVWADTTIVITFSEPMDRVSTQAAWQTPNIGDAVMMWSDDDTELTVVPNAPLPYAMGDDEPFLDAIEYTFTIATTATDAAGNQLESAYMSNFYTWRVVQLQVPFVDQLTGMTGPTVNGINDNDVYVGDTQFDAVQVGVMTFDMPILRGASKQVFSATIYADQTSVGGDPYGPLPSLGEIHALDVEFATEFMAADVPALSDLGIFSDNATQETKIFDVTEAVAADDAAGNPTTQFRFEFPVGTNGDGVLDRVTFDKDTISLAFEYLTE
ncbi:MAG: Ig-like domain-containing protein [Deltaproteobacteria bacterium]|nr:Ig-like domain-containing protein [Deltaproteobacteria bacterium]